MITFSFIENPLTLKQALLSAQPSYPVNLPLRNLHHVLEDRNPVDPDTFAPRLEAAGFRDVRVVSPGRGFSRRARKAR